MQTVTTIGLDIAKSVFQVHGVDAGGQVVNVDRHGLAAWLTEVLHRTKLLR
jgi:transposase